MGAAYGPNFGIILLTFPFHSYNYFRDLIPLHSVFYSSSHEKSNEG